MNHSLASFLQVPVLATGLEIVLKVTFLLAAGSAAALLLRHRAAASRHVTWLLTLAGALALAGLLPVAPGLAVAVPHWPARTAAPVWAAARAWSVNAAPAMAKPVTVTTLRRERRSDLRSTALPTPESSPTAPSLPSLPLAVTLWLAGAAAVLGWYALGHAGLAVLLRSAAPVHDPHWLRLLEETAARCGVKRQVRLRRSALVGTPIVCGFLRPLLVLPNDSDRWSEERRRVVLFHELAHVARFDFVSQLVARLACALYWFHPGIWMAARRLRNEGERACDDRVLSFGIAGPDYASHLLSIAHGARRLRLAGTAAIAMAQRSTLEGRLLSILDESLERGSLGLRARALGGTAVAALFVALLGVRPIAPAEAGASGSHDWKVTGVRAFEHTVAVEPGETLALHLDTGGSVVLRGWDRREIEIRGRLAGGDWRGVEVGVRREGDRIVLRSTFDADGRSYSTSNDFEIRVPRRFDVRLSSGGGGVTLADLEGTFEGHTGGGELVLEHLTGHASLMTGGGDISVTDSDLSGSVTTGGGMVKFSRVRGGLRGTSGSGPVIKSEPVEAGGATGDLDRIEVDGSRIRDGRTKDRGDEEPSRGSREAGRLDIHKAGGAIRLDEAPFGTRATTGGGVIEIGRAAGTVEASTGGGDITIGPVAGSVGAGTGAGDVHITIADAKGKTQTVVVTSGKGEVVIELPSGMDADFDLETAYTRPLGHATRIVSAWPLEEEKTSFWDDREGTPRKYVRAHGGSVRAKVKVRVKTINGDIEIRTAQFAPLSPRK